MMRTSFCGLWPVVCAVAMRTSSSTATGAWTHLMPPSSCASSWRPCILPTVTV
jgi:hypothetical protein